MKGRLMLADGRDIEWSINGMGVVFWAGEHHGLTLPGRPDVPQIEAAIIGWHAGEAEGNRHGRRMLQEQFHKMMDWS